MDMNTCVHDCVERPFYLPWTCWNKWNNHILQHVIVSNMRFDIKNDVSVIMVKEDLHTEVYNNDSESGESSFMLVNYD